MATSALKKILASDIGGTSSRFGYFESDDEAGGELRLVDSITLATAGSGSFAGLMDALRASDFQLKVDVADIAVFAVAGPVEGAYCNPPNFGWDVDLSTPASFGLSRAVLINDFVAQAYACLTSIGRKAKEILPGITNTTDINGPPGARKTIAVLGPGTGLGKAALIPDASEGGMGYVPMPSEGGHASMPFLPAREPGGEMDFCEFIIKRLGVSYPSIDNVVTGGGMALLHEFLTGEALDSRGVEARLVTGTGGALTLQWGSRLLARVARNFALDTLSTGGLFIAGGVAARTPALLEHDAFKEEFLMSEKHSALLGRIPVHLVTDEAAGLWGAAYRGLMEFL